MSNFEIAPRHCEYCTKLFQPKPRGYNAKYCSDHCKSVNKYAREKGSQVRVLARKRHYNKMKTDPVRLNRHRTISKKYRQKGRDFLARYKTFIGCADCGYKKCAGALQLDHTGPKTDRISSARSSIKRLKREIRSGKCEVRCANCHAEKTEQRRKIDAF